jgi:hypothetical protein
LFHWPLTKPPEQQKVIEIGGQLGSGGSRRNVGSEDETERSRHARKLAYRINAYGGFKVWKATNGCKR